MHGLFGLLCHSVFKTKIVKCQVIVNWNQIKRWLAKSADVISNKTNIKHNYLHEKIIKTDIYIAFLVSVSDLR